MIAPRLAGPALSGSCGVQVAAACQLPASVIQRAAQVAQRAERGDLPGSGRSSAGPATVGGCDGSRQPLQEHNGPLQSPAAKRARVAGLEHNDSTAQLAGEQQAALAAVRATLAAAVQGLPGAAEQLLQLQAAVSSALALGEL